MAYTVANLKADLALRIHDVANAEVTSTQLLNFINMAVYDADNAGWLKPVNDDTSLVEAINVFDFNIPTGLIYVNSVRRENVATLTYDFEFPDNYWDLRLIGGVAQLHFDERVYLPDAGAHLMLMGQGRPTIYVSDTDTIDNMFQSFLRERATGYAAAFVAGGISQYSQYRQQLSDRAFAISEMLLARSPQEFRMQPNSKKVPGA